jgi:hypothetical protein
VTSFGLPYSVFPYYGTAFGFGGLGFYSGLGLYSGYYDPFGYGYGYGYPGAFGYGYDNLYGYRYGYPNSYSDTVPGSSPDSTPGLEGYPRDSQGGPAGGLRLKIEPRNAQVFVDGYYAGVVDDFDGRFQKLELAPGRHHIEVRAASHEPLNFDVNIQPRQTTVYRGTLVP